MLRADDDLVQIALKQLRDHVSVFVVFVKEFTNNLKINRNQSNDSSIIFDSIGKFELISR